MVEVVRAKAAAAGAGDVRPVVSAAETLDAEPAGCQNSAVDVDLVFYATCSYSLMRPPRTGRCLICCWVRSAAGWSGRGRVQLAASVGAWSVVVGLVPGHHGARVAFAGY
jgi:hypothetical protein